MLANPPMFKGYTFIIPVFWVETSKVGYPISSGEDSLDYPLISSGFLRSIPDFWGRFERVNPTASSKNTQVFCAVPTVAFNLRSWSLRGPRPSIAGTSQFRMAWAV